MTDWKKALSQLRPFLPAETAAARRQAILDEVLALIDQGVASGWADTYTGEGGVQKVVFVQEAGEA